jgi:predicted component of viral defense system (DUF524 family)
MSDSEFKIPFLTNDGQIGLFQIYEETNNSLFQIDKAEAITNSESEWQILEGRSYEYILDNTYCLEASDIVSRSRAESFRGRISPNIYVGTLSLDILDYKTQKKCSQLNLEVRSVKTTYRTDYRQMLGDITDRCTDLLLQHSSPVSQTFTIDYNKDSQTLYQRFSFLKSIIESEEFDDSVHKILSSPVTQWAETEIYRDIRGIRKANSKTMRQIASAQNRLNLPITHPLYEIIRSVPQKINVTHKRETVDTPENRFIKYALQSFLSFCEELKQNQKATLRLKNEASVLLSKLDQYLGHSIFKEISRPTTLPLNSPILQKKEGYREILQTWLMFELAAKLTWQGGEDVYSGGKRDIAVLYEYWLFFKLLELLKEVFKIEPKSIEELIKPTEDGLGLQLKQGKFIAIEGVFETETRKLKIEFSYNKTFSGNSDYPNKGSWSSNMRPDYTLTIWPAGISQEEAEIEEHIVHIHFDAKYKIEKLTDIFASESDLDEEKTEQKKGTFKRADILKMHSYRDAIRRTAGAYVLYPGTESKNKSGFHEILPGLGAFAISPSRSSNGASDLKKFLYDVIDHFLNRASQREKMAYRTFEIYQSENPKEVREMLPEAFGKNRNFSPDEVTVLVGFCKSKEHFDWIVRSGYYNARAETSRGSLRLAPGETNARYILMHTEDELHTDHLFRVIEKGPRIFSAKKLKEKGYPSEPSGEFYLVYSIDKSIEPELTNRKWDISQLSDYKPGRGSVLPFAVSLTELMMVVEK